MAKVSKLVNLALKDAGVIGNGQTPSADDAETALDTLNQMLAQWRTSELEVYALQNLIIPVVTNKMSYTVGPGGDLDVERPHSVTFAAWRNGVHASDLLYPLRLMPTLESWQRITIQPLTNWPSSLLYEPTFPLGTVYIWPQPSWGQIELTVKAFLPSGLVLGDDVMLPPEYDLAVRFNLAKLLCGAFGSPLRPDIAQLASSSLRTLKRAHTRVRELQMPAGTPSGQGIGRLNVIDNQFSV